MNVKAGGATFDTNGNTLTLSSSLSGPGGVTQTGNGKLVLAASNTFAGPLTIAGGTVQLMPVLGASALWLDATDSAHVLTSGSAVTAWQDHLGRGDGLTQADPNRQPTLVASGINGMPSIHFSAAGTADQLSNTVNHNSPVTIFSVSALTGGANQRFITATTNNWLLGYWGGNIDSAWFNDGWVCGPSTPADTRAHMYEAVIRGAGGNSDVYVYDARSPNIVQLASNQNSVNGPNGLSLGYWPPNPGEASNGDVAELLLYRGLLTDSQRTYVENYLLNGWFGTSRPLPVYDFILDTAPVDLTASSSVLDLNNNSETIGSLAGAPGSRVLLGSGTLTTGGNNANSVFQGVISGSGGLIQTGAGVMTLTEVNTFSGNTSVLAGTLKLTHPTSSNTLPSSPVLQVNQGAILDVTGLDSSDPDPQKAGKLVLAPGRWLIGNGTVAGSAETVPTSTLGAGSPSSLDPPGTPGHLIITGNVTLSGTLMADLAGLNQGTSYDWVDVKGLTILGGGVDINLVGSFTPSPGDRFTILTSVGGIIDWANLRALRLDWTHAPMNGGWWALIEDLPNNAGQALVLIASREPTSLLLLGGGLLALLRRRRKTGTE